MNQVIERLLGRGRPFLVLPAPDTQTPEENARAHGVEPDELIRTEVVTAADGPVLLVLPAVGGFDLGLAQRAVGDRGARPATDAEVRAIAPGCERDAMPPFGPRAEVTTIVDPAVAALDQVAFPAGRSSVLVVMQRADLFGDLAAVVPLTAASAASEAAFAPPRRATLADAPPPVHLVQERPADGR